MTQDILLPNLSENSARVMRLLFAPASQLTREETVQRIRMLAEFLDNQFVIPGTRFRFGWDALIGLVPGIGDLVTTGLAAYIVYLARELGVPRRLLARMVWNLSVDFVGGALPLVGDIFDATFRANQKNLQLLERHLQKTARAAAKRAA